MPEFLSDKWFADLAERAGSATPPADIELTIDQVIEATATWRTVIAGGSVTIDREPTGEPDVRIVTDHATAVSIRSGTVSAQRAFLDGQLRIGGDIASLMAHRDALAEIGIGIA